MWTHTQRRPGNHIDNLLAIISLGRDGATRACARGLAYPGRTPRYARARARPARSDLEPRSVGRTRQTRKWADTQTTSCRMRSQNLEMLHDAERPAVALKEQVQEEATRRISKGLEYVVVVRHIWTIGDYMVTGQATRANCSTCSLLARVWRPRAARLAARSRRLGAADRDAQDHRSRPGRSLSHRHPP